MNPHSFYSGYEARHLAQHLPALSEAQQRRVHALRRPAAAAPSALEMQDVAAGPAPARPRPFPWRTVSVAAMACLTVAVLLWLRPAPAKQAPTAAPTRDAVGRPALGTPTRVDPRYDEAQMARYWPLGNPPAERLRLRTCYALGMPDAGPLPRWVGGRLQRGAVMPTRAPDPDFPERRIGRLPERYTLVALLPPELMGGYPAASVELGYDTLWMPMTRAAAASWAGLTAKASGFEYIMAGPLLNESIPRFEGVPVPHTYFVVFAGSQGRTAYWVATEDGYTEQVDPGEVERRTGLRFFHAEPGR